MKIDGFGVRNFKGLREVSFGRFFRMKSDDKLADQNVLTGKGGTGKSSIVNAFGFLHDCFQVGLEDAWSRRQLGDSKNRIEYSVCFREDRGGTVFIYDLSIGQTKGGRPYFQAECLRVFKKGSKYEEPSVVMHLKEGKGVVCRKDCSLDLGGDWSYCDDSIVCAESQVLETHIDKFYKPGISISGELNKGWSMDEISRFICSWGVVGNLQDNVRVRMLSGAFVGKSDVERYISLLILKEVNHPKLCGILKLIPKYCPDIVSSSVEIMSDGNSTLKFKMKSGAIKYPRQMPGSFLKLIAYLILLRSDEKFPFLIIDLPEDGLPEDAVENFVDMAEDSRRSRNQVLIVTNSFKIKSKVGIDFRRFEILRDKKGEAFMMCRGDAS